MKILIDLLLIALTFSIANAAPMGIVWHRIKTDPFSQSVTLAPTLGGGGLRGWKYITELGYNRWNSRILDSFKQFLWVLVKAIIE